MKRMVVGFAFNKDKSKVALVLKNRPHFLAGKYNGIGGKVEEIDEFEIDAMVREFKEEAGCDTTHSDWIWIGDVWSHTQQYAVKFFTASLDDERFNAIHTVEDEEIHIINCDEILFHPIDKDALLFLLGALRTSSILIHMDFTEYD